MESSSTSSARQIFAAVKASLEAQPWCRDARETWPTPIANEVAQLLRMLGTGTDAGGLLMQVRDTAEVLLKTITAITAADLIAHGGTDSAILARQALFSGRLLLGTWKAAFASLAGAPRDGLLAPELLGLAQNDGDFLKAIQTYIEYRNSDVGHGAYRPDSVEIAERIEIQLLGTFNHHRTAFSGGLDRAFVAVAATGIWRDAAIHADSAAGPAFTGALAAQQLRDTAHAHYGTLRHLYLVRGDRSLDLFPFLAGRICTECQARDAFLFDSARSPKPKDDPRFDFLDYANGHKLAVNAGKTEPALAELADIPVLDIVFQSLRNETDNRGEFANRDVIRLLDDIMFDNRFLSPKWLRERLRRHMEQHRSGIYWLQAPGHVGKTTFVRGLWGKGFGETARRKQHALLGDRMTLAMAPLFLKREYRFDINQFASALESQVRSALRVDTRVRLMLPTKGTPDELKAGFADFARAAWGSTSADRLIIAIDGLDELRDPEGQPSAIDCIPPAQDLPDGVTLLLTSRPVDACPPWLRIRLGQGFAPGHDAHIVGVDDAGYRALLRDYIGRHSGVTPDEADFEEVCDTILKCSNALFLFVSFLCDLVRDGAASGDDRPVEAEPLQ